MWQLLEFPINRQPDEQIVRGLLLHDTEDLDSLLQRAERGYFREVGLPDEHDRRHASRLGQPKQCEQSVFACRKNLNERERYSTVSRDFSQILAE